MKHKRSEVGFALHLILILILMLAAIGLSGWYVIKHQSHTNKSSNNQNQASTPRYTPGWISINFNDGVTSDQALQLIDSYALKTVASREEIIKQFMPTVVTGVRQDHGTAITDSIKQNPHVLSITSDKQDTGNDIHFFTINFKDGTTKDQINQILTSINTVDHQVYSDTNAQKFVVVEGSVGQEDRFVDTLRQSPLINSANRYRSVILQ